MDRKTRMHSCDQCTYQTKWKSNLNKHKVTHGSDRNFECTVCGKKFKWKENLKQHVKIFHRELNNDDECINDNFRLYSCDQCTYQAAYKCYLIRHKLKHENVRNFECSYCGKKFKEKKNMRQHEKFFHEQSNSDDEGNNDNKPRMYSCDQCTFQVKYKFYLMRHKQRHEKIFNFECTICGKKFRRKDNLVRHRERIHIKLKKDDSKQRTYSCDQCKYQTKRKFNLTIHKIRHENIRNFECTICREKFKTKGDLMSHIRNVHKKTKKGNECNNDKKPRMYSCDQCTFQTKYNFHLNRHKVTHENVCNFECTICREKFKMKSDLVSHTKNIHTQSRKDDECNNDKKPLMYSCDQCSFQTKYNFHLNRHKVTHENIRNFECTICREKFKMKGDLESHTKNIHTQSKKDDECNEKKPLMYSCDQCSFQTKYNFHLNRHKVIHKNIPNFECAICREKFKMKGDLESHIKNVHTQSEKDDEFNNDKKPVMYSCDQCSFQTKYNFHLNRHKVTHKRVRNFACTICREKFKMKGDLESHTKKFHRQSKNNDKCNTSKNRYAQEMHNKAKIADLNFYCRLCKSYFETEERFKKHNDKH